MDQVTKQQILTHIKVEVVESGDVCKYQGHVDLDTLAQLVSDPLNPLEWQDPNAYDCGNNNGVWYVYLPIDEELEQGELFIALDPSTNEIHVC